MYNKSEEIKNLIKSGYDLELISLELDISREEIDKCIEEIREEVGKLVASGYDLDLISFELDIPMKLMSQYKMQIEPTKQIKSKNVQKLGTIGESKASLDMQQLRKKYMQLYLMNNTGTARISNQISEQEIEFINSKIEVFEDKVKQIKDLLKDTPNDKQEQSEILRKRRKIADEILVDIKEIKENKMTVEQLEKIIQILDSDELKNLRISSKDKIDSYMKYTRKIMIRKFAQVVKESLIKVTQLEDLKNLYRKLSKLTTQEYEMTVESAKTMIDSKIRKIQEARVIDKFVKSLPKDLIPIVENLASDTIDIDSARELIKIEAKKRMESKTKTKFTLTEEQERERILMQIKNVLMEEGEKYSIINPENTILRVQELCGSSLQDSIRVVVKNFIQRGNFEQARQICKSFSMRDKEGTMSRSIRRLECEINSAEIGAFVLKGINMKSSLENEAQFFNLIKRGLENGNVSMQSISLGKSKDGLRNITLADIWSKEAHMQIK